MRQPKSGHALNTKNENSRKQTRFRYSFLKIFSGSDLSRRRLPLMQAAGEAKGPTVWLTACCHGDEVGGMVVVQEVFRRLRKQRLLCGKVLAFPLMNPIGFEAAARHITFSEEDLNRAFPGDCKGTLAERIAAMIFDKIVATEPAVVIDIHNDWIRSIPYAVLDPPAAPNLTEAESAAETFADASGFLVVTEPNPLRRTLSHSLLAAGVSAVTIELGESFVVNETNVQYGVRSIFNMLASLEMVESNEAFEYTLPTESTLARKLIYSQLSGSRSGVTRFLVQPGDVISEHQPVAKIVNAFGKLQETVSARTDGVVLALADSAVAFPGAPIAAIARW